MFFARGRAWPHDIQRSFLRGAERSLFDAARNDQPHLPVGQTGHTDDSKLLRYLRVHLKTPDAPGQRAFSRRAASFFLEIRQYSCEKMSCAARKFLAAGHIGSFQIHPK